MNPYKILFWQQKKRKPHNPDLPKVIKNKKDGSMLVLVPAGDFIMGSDPKKDKDAYDNEQPQHMHYLPDYYIGIYAITNKQYVRFIHETDHRPPDKADWGAPVWKYGQCPEEMFDHPVVCVSWKDAIAYCKWAGLMLPTEAMWEKAARGCDGRIYPWGDKWNWRRCNIVGGKTCEVWGYPGGIGPNGIYQAGGNVWELCNEWYDEEAYKRYSKGNYSQPKTGTCRVLRGGSSSTGISYIRCGHRDNCNPGDFVSTYGFRPSKLVTPWIFTF